MKEQKTAGEIAKMLRAMLPDGYPAGGFDIYPSESAPSLTWVAQVLGPEADMQLFSRAVIKLSKTVDLLRE